VPVVAPSSLKQTAARLAAGSVGRTEADIQSDVRMFLLDAPLDLAGGDLTEVLLEAQAGGGRRIDVEAGAAAIEVKKSLASPKVLEAARDQLAGYVRQRTDETAQRYVGILTDGKVWILYRLTSSDELVEAARFVLSGGGDAERLAAWLEAVLATGQQLAPTPKEILRQLGANSPGFKLDLADLRALYDACSKHPEVQLKRELWARLLVAALGTNFEATDELFVTHTYLVLTAELLAHAVAGISVDTPGGDVRALLEGQQFNLAGIHGVVEADFFDWPAITDDGALVVRAIARRLSRFTWEHVEHDVLKALYESVIDAETRHRLGEYYTPDWLAQRMVEQLVTDPLTQRVLDPACGSGTFLFWAVRRVLAACDEAGLGNRETLARVVANVQGIDLHPVAVTLARVTYLLGIGRERLRDRSELTVPIYLGDSVRWEQDISLLQQGGITIRTSDGLELIHQELHFPEGVLEDPVGFDRLVAALADKAASRPAVSQAEATKKNVKLPSITGILNAHNVPDTDRAAVELVFEKLCRLHDAGRDHVWGYYIRNLARPIAFTRPDGQADVLVGNPPWLAFRHMPELLQERYRALAQPRGLWAGGKVATHQDLSDLFVVRAVEQYLRPNGRFGFVMPFAVLSRRQYEGFRSGDWSSLGGGTTAVAFDQPEEFARVKPPLFPVPACVIRGVKSRSPKPLIAAAVKWTGRVPSHQLDWSSASPHLTPVTDDISLATDAAVSPYRARFSQGANVVPRMLLTVIEGPVGPLGIAAGHRAVRSARSAVEKEPWKSLPSLEGVIEQKFVRPMHLGATIVAYRPRKPWQAIIPWTDGKLMDGTSDRLDEFPGLAAWWREAERLWAKNKRPASKLSLREQIDFQGKLARQFPIASQRVVYTKSGQHIAACRISDTTAIIDHKLYWAACESIEEARYLTAILNSDALTRAVAPLQARGQHNPRDFDMHVFALGFPAFDRNDALHGAIAALAERAEEVATNTELDDQRQFQRARRVVRQALAEDGVAEMIDGAVNELLRASASPLLREARADTSAGLLSQASDLGSHDSG
jgi:SAM-dependent methyltransferase